MTKPEDPGIIEEGSGAAASADTAGGLTKGFLIMEHTVSSGYTLRLLDPDNKEELKEVQRLRYTYLLREFDGEKSDPDGLDNDGYDAYADSIVVTENRTGRIVGTYRLATEDTLRGAPFKSEEEFDISPLKKAEGGIVEAGRAVVHGDFRNGAVISLLWKGLISYAKDRGLRYIIGTCSLHGTDPSVYEDCTSVLREKYLCEDFDIRAVREPFEYGMKTGLSPRDAGIPGLLSAYLRFGAAVSRNGFIDRAFNCCDVMIVLDLRKANDRLIKRITG